MIQQPHFRVYIQRKWNHYPKKVSVLPCSQQHYSQYPKYGNNLSDISRWTDKENVVYTYICIYIYIYIEYIHICVCIYTHIYTNTYTSEYTSEYYSALEKK